MIAMILVLLLVLATPAQAYVDPGSGTMLYQVVVAAILGFGLQFRKLARMIRRARSRPKPEEGIPATAETSDAMRGGR